MTWSIVARDSSTGHFGVAVTTCNLAVGSICPWLRAGVGALSTQSFANLIYGPLAIEAMTAGASIEETVLDLTARDDGREYRQVHGVDASGRSFAWTGSKCVDWNGSRTADGVSVAGNMLMGPEVVDATFETWRSRTDLEFAERLLTALAAGEGGGGDARGRMSAALVVVTTEPYPLIDLRVDHHPDPVAELQRLYGVWCEMRKPGLASMARTDDISGLSDPEARAAFEARVERTRAAVAEFRRQARRSPD